MDVTKAPTTTDLASSGVGTAVSSASGSPDSAAAGVSIASNASRAVTAAADRVDIQPLDVAAALQILIAELRAELPLPGDNSPAGMALDMQLADVGPQANTPPALQTAELVAPDTVAADLVAQDLVAARPLPPTPGYLPEALDPSAGAGAAAVPWPPSLRPEESAMWPQRSPVIPPGFDSGPLEQLFTLPGALLSSPAQASPVLMRLFLQAVPEDAGNPARWSATVSQLEVTLQSSLDRAVAAVEQWRNVPQVVVDAARETRSLVMSQLNDEPLGPLWLRPEWMWLSPLMERFRRRRRLARRGLTDPDLWSLPEDDIRPEARGRRDDEP